MNTILDNVQGMLVVLASMMMAIGMAGVVWGVIFNEVSRCWLSALAVVLSLFITFVLTR